MFLKSIADLHIFPLRDKEGTQLHDSWEGTKKDYKEKALHYAAIQLIKTGDVTKVVDKEGTVTAKG